MEFYEIIFIIIWIGWIYLAKKNNKSCVLTGVAYWFNFSDFLIGMQIVKVALRYH